MAYDRNKTIILRRKGGRWRAILYTGNLKPSRMAAHVFFDTYDEPSINEILSQLEDRYELVRTANTRPQ